MKELFLNEMLVKLAATVPAEALSLMVDKVMREQNLVDLIDEGSRNATPENEQSQSTRDEYGL